MGDLTDFSVSASKPETLTYSQFEENQCQDAGSCIAVIPTRDDWRDLLLQVFQHVVFLRSRNGYDAHGR
jgi:hypothetical protein